MTAATVQDIAEGPAARRSFETHWRMNPATRAVFDEVLDAALAAHGDEPFSVVLDVGCGRQSNVVFPGAELVVAFAFQRRRPLVDPEVEAALASRP